MKSRDDSVSGEEKKTSESGGAQRGNTTIDNVQNLCFDVNEQIKEEDRGEKIGAGKSNGVQKGKGDDR